MPTFPSKPLRKPNTFLSRLTPRVRKHPLLLFGLPFMTTMVAASFGLSYLTQTRYDYNATKVQSMSKEEELKMRKDRKRIDIREEYFRLQSKADELDDWEPKRVERPEGVPDFPPPQSRTIQNEGLSMTDTDKERQSGLSSETARSPQHQPKVILGPDGKPCRACNSKLAFAAAMKGSAKGDKSAKTPASLASAATVTGALARPSSPECPPDGEELGRSTWAFLHSTAAYFPPDPSAQQQSSMLALLRALPDLYPCHSCAIALGEEYAREEREGGWQDPALRLKQAVKSGPSLRKWLCGIHNEVNQRLGKPSFPCTERTLGERWLDGPPDGGCG